MKCDHCGHAWSDHDVYGCTRNRCHCVNPFRLTMPAWFSSIGKGALSGTLAGVLIALAIALAIGLGMTLAVTRPDTVPSPTPSTAPLKTAHQEAPK